MFQSLIGTVQHAMVLGLRKFIRFQSLIGTVQPNVVGSCSVPAKLFQSLIGTVQPQEN